MTLPSNIISPDSIDYRVRPRFAWHIISVVCKELEFSISISKIDKQHVILRCAYACCVHVDYRRGYIYT